MRLSWKKSVLALSLLGLALFGAFLVMTQPSPLEASALPQHKATVPWQSWQFR